jgi:hypothetical protein
MYVKEPEIRRKEVLADKRLNTKHGILLTTVIVVGISVLIGVGFAYAGYTSGHFSHAYVLCKENTLSQVRVGAFQSIDEVTAAIKSCDGVIS